MSNLVSNHDEGKKLYFHLIIVILKVTMKKIIKNRASVLTVWYENFMAVYTRLARMFNLWYILLDFYYILLHCILHYTYTYTYVCISILHRYHVLYYVVKALEVFIASREKSQHHTVYYTMNLACVNRESQQLSVIKRNKPALLPNCGSLVLLIF